MIPRVVLAACLLAVGPLSSPGWALPKYADWARVAATGLPIAGAHITVIEAHSGAPATIFQDAAGTVSLANPFIAGSSGYFEFFAEYGEYAVSVSADGTTEVYRITHVLLVDPTGPKAICSNSGQAALTTVQVGVDHPFPQCPPDPNSVWGQFSTTALRFERRAPDGTPDGAPWLLDGYRAEQGLHFHYNSYWRPRFPG